MKKFYTVYYDYINPDGTTSDVVYEWNVECENAEEAIKDLRSKSWADGNERILQVSLISPVEIDRICHADGEIWHKAYQKSVSRRDEVACIIGDYEPDGKVA